MVAWYADIQAQIMPIPICSTKFALPQIRYGDLYIFDNLQEVLDGNGTIDHLSVFNTQIFKFNIIQYLSYVALSGITNLLAYAKTVPLAGPRTIWGRANNITKITGWKKGSMLHYLGLAYQHTMPPTKIKPASPGNRFLQTRMGR